jgi:hypothetical protein
MKRLERDDAHLWDMLDAAQQADEFANGIALDTLLSDTRTRFAIERALEIIGKRQGAFHPGHSLGMPRSPGKVSSGFAMCLPMSTVRSIIDGSTR